MTVMQAEAALILWRTQRYCTADLAHLLGVSEADICRMLDAVRTLERGPDLRVIEGSLA